MNKAARRYLARSGAGVARPKALRSCAATVPTTRASAARLTKPSGRRLEKQPPASAWITLRPRLAQLDWQASGTRAKHSPQIWNQ